MLTCLTAAITFFAAVDPSAAPAQPKTELNFIPVVGGDSDVGIGGGLIGDLARLDRRYQPFRWRIEVAAVTTFKLGSAEGTGAGTKQFTIPFQDYYLLLDLPQLTPSRRLRLQIRPSFTWESTQKFYGVGNGSRVPPVPRSQIEYGRRHAALIVAARVKLAPAVYLRAAVDYTENWLQIPPNGILGQMQLHGPERVRKLVDGPDRHGVAGAEISIEYDTRDSELVTHSGSYHQVKLRFSPRLGPHQPYRYGEANVTLRHYRAPLPWLELAGRLVYDILTDDPPFYELTRVDGNAVTGGGKGIRGVPAQRYYGKVKLFGNFEARAQVLRWTMFAKPFGLALAGFFDGGRVWADGSSAPELDGPGVGLKYGVGGGIRLQQGHTFVVRFDVAWSPDANPVGAYFNAGEIFSEFRRNSPGTGSTTT